jgi:hypothetical protein
MTITQAIRTEAEKFGSILQEYERTDRVGFITRHTNQAQTTFTWVCVVFFYFNGNLVQTVEATEQTVNVSLLPDISTIDSVMINVMSRFIDTDRIHFSLVP